MTVQGKGQALRGARSGALGPFLPAAQMFHCRSLVTTSWQVHRWSSVPCCPNAARLGLQSRKPQMPKLSWRMWLLTSEASPHRAGCGVRLCRRGHNPVSGPAAPSPSRRSGWVCVFKPRAFIGHEGSEVPVRLFPGSVCVVSICLMTHILSVPKHRFEVAELSCHYFPKVFFLWPSVLPPWKVCHCLPVPV